MVPNLFGTGPGFVEDSFPTDGGVVGAWDGFGMTQVHCAFFIIITFDI